MERERRTSVLRFGTYEVDPDSGDFARLASELRFNSNPLSSWKYCPKHPRSGCDQGGVASSHMAG